jgi:SSS family solute:Na+ symporter
MGVAARLLQPDITDANAVLPTLLMRELPAWLGALALAAVFSTEVDTSDAILFMVSTSASKDIYKRFVNPAASDAALLRVGRLTAVLGGTAGVVLAIWLPTVIGALTIFYSMLVVTLAVPIVGGLYAGRATEREALAAIVAGVLTLLVLEVALADTLPWLDPTLAGILAGAAAFVGAMVTRPRR